MADLKERIDALSAVVALWPEEPAPDSGFARDALLSTKVSSFVLARMQLLTALRRLRNAFALKAEDDGWGTHVLMLRPALVMASKAAWIVREDLAPERVGRALGILLNDQRRGAKAMREAVRQGALREFNDVATTFDRQTADLVRDVSVPEIRQPSDEKLIQALGRDIDTYYGTVDAIARVQLLWNASSCLAHGETWFPLLSGGMQRRPFGEILTQQSFDVVCSAINTTALGIMDLASGPPPPTP